MGVVDETFWDEDSYDAALDEELLDELGAEGTFYGGGKARPFVRRRSPDVIRVVIRRSRSRSPHRRSGSLLSKSYRDKADEADESKSAESSSSSDSTEDETETESSEAAADPAGVWPATESESDGEDEDPAAAAAAAAAAEAAAWAAAREAKRAEREARRGRNVAGRKRGREKGGGERQQLDLVSTAPSPTLDADLAAARARQAELLAAIADNAARSRASALADAQAALKTALANEAAVVAAHGERSRKSRDAGKATKAARAAVQALEDEEQLACELQAASASRAAALDGFRDEAGAVTRALREAYAAVSEACSAQTRAGKARTEVASLQRKMESWNARGDALVKANIKDSPKLRRAWLITQDEKVRLSEMETVLEQLRGLAVLQERSLDCVIRSVVSTSVSLETQRTAPATSRDARLSAVQGMSDTIDESIVDWAGTLREGLAITESSLAKQVLSGDPELAATVAASGASSAAAEAAVAQLARMEAKTRNPNAGLPALMLDALNPDHLDIINAARDKILVAGRKWCLAGPRRGVFGGIECEFSVHRMPRAMTMSLVSVFPEWVKPCHGRAAVAETNAVVVPISQYAAADLADWSAIAAGEKDVLLENFVALAEAVEAALAARARAAGAPPYVFDFTDPASGIPQRSQPGPSTYADVTHTLTLLRYPTVISGPCTMLSHPEWGTAVYPTTMFSTASPSLVTGALDDVFGSGSSL
ncbi:uncharacterized protein AMSG_08846 [Thecamonas trahens ATCC 50062]|uniref:Uncharacterized protein n=1 Tax=Thecamonas trahens ATCC 50062 TaxID=461836 RepID=A0A0L0DM52_THETB|nr:hypothetical protein AMSG_08846 [Thecamonas trahens ATCC 50062]KNC53345.1 hypothetical protein AMSG_08846 [Thecamonas trahens ATCC 50062]|eukprot:XP_013754393.1 hypothetical protein AMSG_08846 [Thecamonas trahens ATCC 50062]